MKYRLWYIEHIPAQQYIVSTVENLREDQIHEYAQQIGDIFIFEIYDGFIKKTLLKNEMEVHKFIKWYNQQFSQKIKIQSLKNNHQFQGINKIDPIKEKKCFKFMELQNQDIFHYKALSMEYRNQAKRWYDYLCICCYDAWEKSQIIITTQGILQKTNNYLDDFLLFTGEFSFVYGSGETGQQFGIELSTCHRDVMIKANNKQDFLSFIYFLKKAIHLNQVKRIRYDASSLVRYVNKVDFLVDAEDYFREVAFAIQKATQQIFMCGWWISPQLPLVRPYIPQNFKYRLDRLLKSKAQQGVLIYIIVFNSPPVIPNDSKYTETTLRNLHSNIKILSHPCDIIPWLWSHHEKAVVVDQNIAFMGGLDLCYGRYDGSDHPINSSSQFIYPGIEYNNNRLKDFNTVSDYTKDGLSRKLPRMPWHDVALKIEGRAVADLSNHFVEYWNNSFLENFVIQERNDQVKQIDGKQIDFKVENQYHTQKKIHPKGSMTDKTQKQIKKNKIKNKQQTSNNRNQMTHITLVQDVITKQKQRARKSLQSLIKDTHKKIKQVRDPSKIYDLVISTRSLGLRKLEEQAWQIKKKQYPDHCQLLRSASQWSIGLQNDFLVERSIQNAYLSVIQNAKTHIYIQNQFFISANGAQNSYIKNQIVNAICQRISKAIKQKQKFKVVIFMPLLPGMEGQINQNIPTALRLVLHWQYKTIYIGDDSLFGRLKKLTPNPTDYLQFFSLRQHGLLNGTAVTQLIYIHTKLMIVDDQIVICGSANINDRSQQGERDSQLAMIVTEGKKITKCINNKDTIVSEKAHNLRVKLYCEHFGFTEKECEDPLNPQLAKKISKRAKINTETYRMIFGCVPDNNVKTLEQVQKFMKVPTVEQYQNHKDKIQGHVVEFPLQFLSNQQLSNYDLQVMHDLMS